MCVFCLFLWYMKNALLTVCSKIKVTKSYWIKWKMFYIQLKWWRDSRTFQFSDTKFGSLRRNLHDIFHLSYHKWMNSAETNGFTPIYLDCQTVFGSLLTVMPIMSANYFRLRFFCATWSWFFHFGKKNSSIRIPVISLFNYTWCQKHNVKSLVREISLLRKNTIKKNAQ